MIHPDFRRVFGDHDPEMADRIEKLQRESVQRRETHWERSQRRLAHQQEHQNQVVMAQECLNGSKGDELREKAEELFGTDPEWSNVDSGTLQKFVMIVKKLMP